ncbi:MCE family protein [Adhaeribacter sp. BT258]|uniref:MCE family protein n=1 Tax=Adhaeribacter terrigena TaxID=2793070 RepID=A0ABS1BY32_9BACT|nr:MlaD family protein [Adhaeribacter terrigena]MBK0401948.1 MCE family protein [Adhaeribacter terrigena]
MRITKEIKVALLGIAAAVALYFGYSFLRGSNLFSDTRTFYALYDTVDGLTISNPVLLNGVKIGIVQDVKLQPKNKNRILVTMDINEDIDVGDSTIANLSSSSILGGKAITLIMRANTRRYEGGDTLISFTEKSLTDMLTAKAMPLMGSVDSTLLKINSFFDKDAKKSMQATMLNAQASTEAMKNILIMNQRNMHEITTNLSELTYSLKATQRKFDRLAGNLTTITDTLKNSELNDAIRNMNATVTEAQIAVKKFNENNGTLGKLMNDDSLYNNLNSTAKNMDALMIDLKANPKRYVHFSVFGKGAGSGDTKVEKANVVNTKGTGEVKIKEVNNVDTTRKPTPATK